MIRRTMGKFLGAYPRLIPYVAPMIKYALKLLPARSAPPLENAEQRELQSKLEDRLLMLDVETTNICNANCSFCAYRFRTRRPRIMTNREFSSVIERYSEYGGGNLSLTPLVGDALLDKGLVGKIVMARQHKEIGHIGFATNLIALGRHDLKSLLTSGLNLIYVSTCLGDRDMYRRVYGVDKYETVPANLLRLIGTNDDLGKPVEIGISLRGEKPYRKVFAGADYQRVVKLLGRYISIIDDDYVNWTGLIESKDLPRGNALRRIGDMRNPCEQFYHGLQIFANGDVGLCCCVDMDCRLMVGNIYKQSIQSIWTGPEVRNLRAMWLSGDIPDPCNRCTMYSPLPAFLALNKDMILQASL